MWENANTSMALKMVITEHSATTEQANILLIAVIIFKPHGNK